MPDARCKHWLPSLLLDLLPWAFACCAFLWIYVHVFGRPTTSMWPHVRIVATLWLALACLRLVAWRCTSPGRLVRGLLSFVCTLPLVLMLLHYALILVGLSSWGRVPTWALLCAYATQFGELMAALGYPLALPVVAAAFTFAVLWTYEATLGSGEAWGRGLLQRLPDRTVPLVLSSLAALIALQSWRILVFPALSAGEPFALTFVETPMHQFQSHATAGTAGDTAEDAARMDYLPATAPRRSNVILIIGDALRSDHLGLYGYGRPVTPTLDAIAKAHSARVAPRMRAACAESSCGLLALAASRYVHQFSTRPITLQEVLRRNGYKVHMILGGDHTHFYGLREAYGEVDSYFDGRMQVTHPMQSTQAMQYMNDDQLVLDYVARFPDANPAQPVMMQFHLMSSHGLGKRHENANRYQPSGNYYRHLRGLSTVSPELREEALNYYDNGMIQLDNVLASLLSSLQAKGYLEDALVVLTGDHGEMLGEHGMLAHANGVYEGVLNIPFVLMGFGRDVQPFAQHRLASQVDIAPTLLLELNMPAPTTWRGLPLQLPNTRKMVYFQQGKQTGLYDLDDPDRLWKYWRDWTLGREFVFDIGADPDEAANLIERLPSDGVLHWRRAVTGSLSAAGSGTEDGDPP